MAPRARPEPAGALTRPAPLPRARPLTALLADDQRLVARLARDHLARCRTLTRQINDLERELRALVRRLAPTLLAMPGCGVLGAAMILGETARVHRFRNRDAYARFTGTAPIPVWSGRTEGKVRLNRGGNRTINTALHMIAVTQSRGVGPGGAYLDKLTTVGKTRTEAIRLLRRRLSDAVFALRADQPLAAPAQSAPKCGGGLTWSRPRGRGCERQCRPRFAVLLEAALVLLQASAPGHGAAPRRRPRR